MKKQWIVTSLLLMLSGALLIAGEPADSIREERVTFTNGETSYVGTLSLPATDGICPLVILVSGTGPQTRDWKFGANYRLAKILADSLNNQGIAVYRYDDRGSGESTGTPEMETSYEDLAADIHAAVGMFRTRPEIGRIGLCGHSLGGILAILEASKYQDVDFIITLSGSFITGADILRDQARTLKRWRTSANQTDEEVVNQGLRMVDYLTAYARTGDSLAQVEKILSDLIHFQIDNMKPEVMAKNLLEYKDTLTLFQKSYEGALAYYTSPHEKSFLTYDASIDFARVTCPVLVLFGERDQHVMVSTNKPRLISALQNAQCTDFTLRIIPGADHGYTTSTEEYKKGRIAGGVTGYMGRWVVGKN